MLVAGTGMYHIDIKHDGLRKSRRLSGADQYVLDQRARVQLEAWDECWRRRQSREQSDESLRHLPNFEAQKAHAAKLTEEAEQAAASWTKILPNGLENAPFKMEMLHDSRIFPEQRPVAPVEQEAPDPPDRNDPSFNTVEQFEVWAEFWALLFPRVKRKRDEAVRSRRAAAQSRYDLAYRKWQDARQEIVRSNAKARVMFELALDQWWERAQAHQKWQQSENVQIEKFRLRCAQGRPEAVVEFLDTVLSHAEYPDAFPMRWDMVFLTETGALIVDYELPPPDDFPKLKAVKYDVMADTFEQGYWPAPDIAQFYDAAVYQTCFRTLHELFAADEAEVIDSVTFNGWVNFTDKVHGRPARACILSVQVPKTALKQVNLSAADLKPLFKSWKGVAGANLADMAAVDPVLPLKKTENRPLPANDMMEKGAVRQPPPMPGSKEHG